MNVKRVLVNCREEIFTANLTVIYVASSNTCVYNPILGKLSGFGRFRLGG